MEGEDGSGSATAKGLVQSGRPTDLPPAAKGPRGMSSPKGTSSLYSNQKPKIQVFLQVKLRQEISTLSSTKECHKNKYSCTHHVQIHVNVIDQILLM